MARQAERDQAIEAKLDIQLKIEGSSDDDEDEELENEERQELEDDGFTVVEKPKKKRK